MHLKSFCLLSLSVLFLLTSFSCKDNVTDTGDDFTPGPRNYTWTIDSLHNYADENMFTKISGSSPEDVWLTGSGDWQESIIHYNGKSFNIVRANPPGEGNGVFTLSPQSTWISSENGNFYRYNGQSLNFVNNISINDTGAVMVRDIWGSGESDLWACGYNWTKHDGQYGMIMKYNGSRWDTVLTEINSMNQFFKIRKGNNTGNKVYMLSFKIDGGRDSVSLYEYDNNSLKIIYSAPDYGPAKDFPALFNLNNNLYFCFSKKIHIYSDNKFKVIKDLSNYSLDNCLFWGRSFNDFFLTYENGIGHYNGSNMEVLFKFPFKGWITDALIFENDVFFVCYNQEYGKRTYLIHGKLNKN